MNFTGKIISMGAINMDILAYLEKQMPNTGETIIAQRMLTAHGGKGGNQAVAAAAMGAEVTFLGKLGDDFFSQALIKELEDSKVHTNRIGIEKGGMAGIAQIWVNHDGRNTIVFSPGANANILPKDIADNVDLFHEGDILMMSAEIPFIVMCEAIRRAHAAGCFVMVDPSPVIGQEIPQYVIDQIDLIKPNEFEAEALCGVAVKNALTAKEAVRRMLDMGYKNPVVTLGKAGCVAAVEGEIQCFSSIEVDSVDTTGAGDNFFGALAAYLSKGFGLREAISRASCCAALSTTKKGARLTGISREEVEKAFLGA